MTLENGKSLYDEATALAQEDETPEGRARVATLLEEAVQLGSGDAAAAIANWLHYGIHYKRDIAREISLLKFAAARDVPIALFTLGSLYEGGKGKHLRKNKRKAFRCYTEAALLGDADAYLEVSRCYRYGIGTSEDRRLSRIWLYRGESLGGKFIERHP